VGDPQPGQVTQGGVAVAQDLDPEGAAVAAVRRGGDGEGQDLGGGQDGADQVLDRQV